MAGAAPVALWLLSACGGTQPSARTVTRSPQRARIPSASVDPMEPADRGLRGPLLSADALVSGGAALPADLVRRIRAIPGVAAVLPVGLCSASFSGRTLTIASVDPEQYRRFTPVATAQDDAVWSRVAAGEIAMDPSVGHEVEQPAGFLTRGQSPSAPSAHVGAYAPLSKHIQAVVDQAGGRLLGIPPDNALLISTGELTPSAVAPRIRALLGSQATLQILALEFDLHAVQTAVLSGTSVASAVGSFTYTPQPDGTIVPDRDWVGKYVTTEQMPIIGNVTGNRAMFPQLQACLAEVDSRGLADTIHPHQYGGCYVPRYIAHDPSLGLSLHSWGIAVDLNVPENLRDTRGHMDPDLVAIFEKWGFDWGGVWHYTDPMHFEMSRVVTPT